VTITHVPSSIKIRIIEREEIFILVINALHCMCLTLREVPDIAKAEFGNLMAPFFVDGRDKHAAKEDLAPLCLYYVHVRMWIHSMKSWYQDVQHDANATL
jgi:hypothetical protein